MELLEIPYARKSELSVNYFLYCVFGRHSVEWHNLMMDILAYRALLAPNFIEKASLILISIEIMCGIILI